MSAAWKPDSWRAKPVQQMAEFYPKEEATKVFDKLGKLPPLVQPAEVDRLQQVLAAAAAGERASSCAGRRLRRAVHGLRGRAPREAAQAPTLPHHTRATHRHIRRSALHTNSQCY